MYNLHVGAEHRLYSTDLPNEDNIASPSLIVLNTVLRTYRCLKASARTDEFKSRVLYFSEE